MYWYLYYYNNLSAPLIKKITLMFEQLNVQITFVNLTVLSQQYQNGLNLDVAPCLCMILNLDGC